MLEVIMREECRPDIQSFYHIPFGWSPPPPLSIYDRVLRTPNCSASSLIKIVDKLPQVCILYM